MKSQPAPETAATASCEKHAKNEAVDKTTRISSAERYHDTNKPPSQKHVRFDKSESKPFERNESHKHQETGDITQQISPAAPKKENLDTYIEAQEKYGSDFSSDVDMIDPALKLESQDEDLQQIEAAQSSAVKSQDVEKAELRQENENLRRQIQKLQKEIKKLQEVNPPEAETSSAKKRKLDDDTIQAMEVNMQVQAETWATEKSRLQDEYQEQYQRHVDACNVWNARSREFRQQISGLQRENDKMKHLEAENAQIHKELLILDDEVQASQRLRQESERKLARKTKECEDLRAQWLEAVNDLEASADNVEKFAVDDDDIISKWGRLDYAIRNLTAQSSVVDLEFVDLDSRDKSFLMSVSPQYAQLIHDKEKSQDFYRALIWRLLYGELFREPSAVWGTTAASSIPSVRKAIATGKQSSSELWVKFHTWRAQTGLLLHEACPPGEAIRDDIEHKLRYWLPLSIVTISPHEARRMIAAICSKAVDLASIFGRSQAYYRVQMNFTKDSDNQLHRGGVRFSEDWMERVPDSDTTEWVELVVVPSLTKQGNSDGNGYEEKISLVRAVVRCETEQRALRSGFIRGS